VENNTALDFSFSGPSGNLRLFSTVQANARRSSFLRKIKTVGVNMKTKTTHTPGPWTVAPGWIKEGYSYRVETVDSFTGKPAKAGSPATSPVCNVHAKAIAGMAEANARLIAAAPDLLAALKSINLNDLTRESDAKVRAAIAKAEGR
jgi:hypothetical protein